MKTQNKIWLSFTGILVGILVFSAPTLKAQTELDQVMNSMPDSFSPTNALPLIDFRILKSLLPEAIEKVKRTQYSGEKSGALGMVVSFAEGVYEGGNDSTLSIKITDLGGMPSFMVMAQATWAAMDIDRETDTEYERTFLYKTFKGHEQYNKDQRNGDLEMLVGKRFRVEISGQNIEAELLRKAVETLDLNKLHSLNPEPQPAPTTNAVLDHKTTPPPPATVVKTPKPLPAGLSTNHIVTSPVAATNAP